MIDFRSDKLMTSAKAKRIMAGHLSEIFCRIHGVILAGACGGILSSQITSSQIGLSIRYLFEIIFISEQFSLFFIGTKPLTVLNRLKV